MSTDLPKDGAQLLSPGAYDRTTLTHRQPGSTGGGEFGSDMPSGASSDAATIAERELEGGGSVRGRRRTIPRPDNDIGGENMYLRLIMKEDDVLAVQGRF